MTTLPRLRAVEAFPVQHQGQRVLALRDPAGYAESVVLLPGPLLEIVSLFDGEHTVVDVQAAVMRQHGRLVTSDEIERVVANLDAHGFLDTPRFAERLAAIEATFRSGAVRAAAHAGGAYAADAGTLRRAMDAFFEPPAGPGPITRESAAAVAVTGVVAPHIDFHRGGPAYAWAYRDVAERCDADLFVIFGTSHAGLRDPFALTRKDYATPLGHAVTDRDFVDALAARARHDCFASEAGHRTEHSIEFQAVFLRYVFGDRPFTIVPVLTSFAHEAMARRRRPEDDPRVAAFLDGVVETAAAQRRRVAYVAGADLAHMGPRFGDPSPVSSTDLARIEREDRAMLETVTAGDPAAFFDCVAADDDRRRICGYSPIYALLHCLAGRRGHLAHYGQWPDPQAVVTHASVVF